MTDNVSEQAKPISITKNTKIDNFYRTFLEIMLGLSNKKLSSTSIDLLVEVRDFGYEFTTDCKRTIAHRTGKSMHNITNYIKRLRDSGFVDEHGVVTKMLQLPVDRHEISLLINIKAND